MPLDFDLDQLNGFPIIKLEGSIIERSEAIDLIDELEEMISQGEAYFILDLSDVTYMNSSGLNVLLNILTRSRNAGGETVICGVNEKLRKLLVITKLDAVFQLANDCDEAAERLATSKQPPTSK